MGIERKLLVVDLDGTALGGGFEPYARFPDPFSAFLDGLSARGWRWALNTTWDPEGQMTLVRDSSVRSRPAFLMAEFGRQLAAVENGEIRRDREFCEANDRRVHACAREKILPLAAEIAGRFQPGRLLFHGHLLSVQWPDEESGPDARPWRDPAAWREFIEPWLADPALECAVDDRRFSARPAFLNKGLPLRRLIERHGHAAGEIVAVGDDTPDLPMMHHECSGHCLCPGNAARAVREHVLRRGGAVGRATHAAGVVEAFEQLERRGAFA